jgi:hypothetical protein
MRALLLGSTGRLGRALVGALLQLPTLQRLTLLVRDDAKARTVLPAAVLQDARVDVRVGDASDAGSVAAALEASGADALLNAAGRPNEPGNDLGPIVDAVLGAVTRRAAGGDRPLRRLVLTGGIGATLAPGAHGPCGLLPLVPAHARALSTVHVSTWAKLTGAAAAGRLGEASFALVCPAYMRDDLPPAAAPLLLTADACPVLPAEGSLGATALAWAPAAAVAAAFGLGVRAATISYEDCAGVMAALAECGGVGDPLYGPLLGHRVGLIRR